MAVVSQPFDRGATCPAPGTPDDELGEFWEEDPWEIAFKHNLSAFERNRTFLNLGGRNFADVSYLTGTDSDGDGRAVVAADFRANGQMDLLVRQAGGGPLLLYENHFPQRAWLKVSLRGHRSNSLGLGARISAETAACTLVRDLFPENTFHSQRAAFVHFGLGEFASVEKLTVRWPGGQVDRFEQVEASQHVVIDEETRSLTTVEPGSRY